MATKTSFSSAAENNTWANFLAWTGSGISAGLTTLGFTAVTDTYAANGGSTSWANGTTNNGLTDPNTIPTGTDTITGLTGTAFPTTSANSRAGLASTNFKGAWSSVTAYTVGQVVTFTPSGGGQQTFMCWATGGVGIAPAGVATSKTFWTPYWFEIWKAHSGSLTDFFFKIEYGGSTSGNTFPEMTIQFGTAADGVGDVNASGNFSLCEQMVSPTGAIAGPFTTFMGGDGANYFCMITWAGATGQNSVAMGFERSISGTVSSAPVYNSSYVTYCINVDLNTAVHQCSLGITATGWNTGTGFNNTSVRTLGCSTITLPTSAATMVVNNNTPILPVFPLVGWTGNPLTALVVLQQSDAVEGASITSTVYGATHTYLCSKITTFEGFGNGIAGAWAIGIRYE